MTKSRALYNERPLLVPPTVAVKLGLNEAVFLQQLHFWLQGSGHKHDGRAWVYNTFEEWQKQMPFWSVRTIQRIVESLRKRGVVITTTEYNRLPMDKTLWYTIDYDRLDSVCDMLSLPSRQVVAMDDDNLSSPSRQVDAVEDDKLSVPITIDYPETNPSETTIDHEPSSADAGAPVRANAEDFKVVVATMEKVGIGLTPFLTDTYHEEMMEHGAHAVVAGMLAAAENHKQHSMKYVQACIRNAAHGREPPKGTHDKSEAVIHGDDYETRRKLYTLS